MVQSRSDRAKRSDYKHLYKNTFFYTNVIQCNTTSGHVAWKNYIHQWFIFVNWLVPVVYCGFAIHCKKSENEKHLNYYQCSAVPTNSFQMDFTRTLSDLKKPVMKWTYKYHSQLPWLSDYCTCEYCTVDACLSAAYTTPFWLPGEKMDLWKSNSATMVFQSQTYGLQCSVAAFNLLKVDFTAPIFFTLDRSKTIVVRKWFAPHPILEGIGSKKLATHKIQALGKNRDKFEFTWNHMGTMTYLWSNNWPNLEILLDWCQISKGPIYTRI